MTRLLVWLRCPACGDLPDGVVSPTQAICGNPDCNALFFDPTQEPAAQLADAHEIRLVDEQSAGRRAGIELPVPARPVGADVDVAVSAQMRAYYHRYGYVCADGECPACGAVV